MVEKDLNPTLKTQISVIIPTYNRLEALQLTLSALKNQTIPSDLFEVIIVDDGSNENITNFIHSLELSFSVIIIGQSHKGPGAARNTGAQKAKGNILLFLDHDMIGVSKLIEEHLNSHKDKAHFSLVAGPRNRFVGEILDHLDWIDYLNDGSDRRLMKKSISFEDSLTCNLSVHRNIWEETNRFREDLFSFEDIEFAYRATKKGVEIKFNKEALAFHNHPLKLEDRIERTIRYTKSVPLLYKLHPELKGKIGYLRDKEPIDWKSDTFSLVLYKIGRWILAWKPIFSGMAWLLRQLSPNNPGNWWINFLYWKVIGSCQWIGMREGIHEYGWIREEKL